MIHLSDTEHDINEIAGVVLYTEDRQFILQRRTSDAKVAPNKLCLFGGHMQEGEKPLQAAMREIHEEVSLPVEQLEYIGAFNFTEIDGRNIVQGYHIYARPVATHHFQIFEGQRAEWLPMEEILENTDVMSATRHAIELFMKEKSWH